MEHIGKVTYIKKENMGTQTHITLAFAKAELINIFQDWIAKNNEGTMPIIIDIQPKNLIVWLDRKMISPAVQNGN
jgi:hypothetical protein